MYSESAEFYDLIYASQGKDYSAEARKIHDLAQLYQKSAGNSLLDVACGTGMHAAHLRPYYDVRGIDQDQKMLEMARNNHPGILFEAGDMRNFNFEAKFDVITCLFSSIGYMLTLDDLQKAAANMSEHLKPGGVLFVEPWFEPGSWKGGSIHTISVDQPDLKIVRMNASGQNGKISFFTYHYLVGTSKGVRYFTEHHELALYSREEYTSAFENAGLKVIFDEQGLYGRGLYIGIRSMS